MPSTRLDRSVEGVSFKPGEMQIIWPLAWGWRGDSRFHSEDHEHRCMDNGVDGKFIK
jgi:hypothetical protein